MIQYKNIHDSNIILMYKGVLTFDLLSSIISTAEQRINEFESERRVQKKFYSILTEAIQNLYYHVEKAEPDENISRCDANSVLILISAKRRYYSIICCNNIHNSEVDRLSEKIDYINSLSPEELKEKYRESLTNDQFSDKNTAGLGLMEIARKTDYKFDYNFEHVNDHYSYFTFEIKLARGSDQSTSKPTWAKEPKVESVA